MDVAVDPAHGLTAAEVADRVARGQANRTAARSSRTVGQIIRANTLTPFNALLGSLLVVILVVGPLQDALFGLVIVANSIVGGVQETRAKRTLDRLAVVGEARPRVRRDGQELTVGADDVVLDDILLVGTGDKIVVDGDVVAAEGLSVDESLLTGEADAVGRRVGEQLLSGSFAVGGHGAYRATRVGSEAYAAQLADEAKTFTLTRSELTEGINRIIVTMAKIMVPVGALLLLSQLGAADGVAAALRGTVAGLVTMVPEGLVLLTSVAFAVGVVRLGRRNVLVQELPAIEGLARVDVVCLDKTGTLTEPNTTVSAVERLVADQPVDQALGALAALADPNASMTAIRAAYPAPDRTALDETAPDETAPDGWRPVTVAPFSSARKWSGATFEGAGTWLLGAPEVLLGPSTGPAADALARAAELAARGLRVLALVRSDEPLPHSADGGPDEAGLDAGPPPVVPVALVSLEQRIRPDAAPTLAYFAAEHVTIKIISGDSPVTVGAIAARLDVPGADHPVDARGLPADDGELAGTMATSSTFGRVTPRQKQRMVAALQARGHDVAMTGDGVNDVLALKTADIGLAMGTGSDATRAVAQVVLLDSSFAAVPGIVAEGRRVIGNVERVANLFLTKTVYATVLSLAVIVARLPFPFLPRHLTLVSSLTIGIPGFFLALLPNTTRARPGFVHRVLRFAVPSGVVAAAASFTAYGVALLGNHVPREQAQTTATLVLFVVAIWVLVIVARPLDGFEGALVVALVAAMGVVLAVPWLRDFFALSLAPRPQLAAAGAIAAGGVVVLEVGWRVSGWRAHHRAAGPAGTPDSAGTASTPSTAGGVTAAGSRDPR